MQITCSLSVDGNLAPVAVNYLPNVAPTFLYHGQHKLRHPLALYNISLQQVRLAFEEVLRLHWEEFEYFHSVIPHANDYFVKHAEELLNAQKALLHAMMEHIDDCYAIMKAFVDPGAVNERTSKQKFNDRYLTSVAGLVG